MLQKYGEKNKNETDKSVLPPFVYGRRHCLTTVFKHKLLVDQKTLNISNHDDDDDDDDVDDDGGGDDDDDAGGRGGGGSQNRLILHPIQYTADLFYTRQGSLLWMIPVKLRKLVWNVCTYRIAILSSGIYASGPDFHTSSL